ncbi:MAG: DNA mismatch repair endonuclease MutL [Firmicutes bacterium]|nr:DNA mismatch repair endonuclease MutL [Bacillota bacterium]
MIKILEKNIADKIAAGEVIDRPVSVVKELVENALDAGADSITVEIRDGGRTYMRVTDNGCGIDSDEAEIAFRRHATSKISDERDLDCIETLGFRGEALASICAVARVELITKTPDAKIGRKVIVESSEVLENTATGCPDGTTVTVKDLFFNVPARYKFLASDASEARKVIDFVSRIALSYPDVRFNLINGGKNVFTTSGKGNILANIISIYGADIGEGLIPVERSGGGFTLKAHVSSPDKTLPSRNRQIFCVNGRIIASSVLERALDRAYAERMFKGRFPIAFLFLAMPAEKLDVNIHPTKKQIRFDDNSEVEDFVTEAIRDALSGEKAVPDVAQTVEERVTSHLKDDGFTYQVPDSAAEVPESAPIEQMNRESELQEQVNIKSILTTLREEKKTEVIQREIPDPVPNIVNRPFDFDELSIIGAVFNTYIVAQDDNSFYLIDQHAAHERIFYEKLLKQYRAEEKASQQLLMPLQFDVPADIVSSEDSWIDKVRSMGYNIEYFGGNTYLVREIPAFMELAEAEAFLGDLFGQLSDHPDLTDYNTLDKIITRSCKSAVKGGDVLDAAEINALIAQLKLCENPFSCPHGRPTFIKLTRYELERMFKRA